MPGKLTERLLFFVQVLTNFAKSLDLFVKSFLVRRLRRNPPGLEKRDS